MVENGGCGGREETTVSGRRVRKKEMPQKHEWSFPFLFLFSFFIHYPVNWSLSVVRGIYGIS